MTYFIKNLTIIFILVFLAFGCIAIFEHGKECQKKADAILIKQAFEDGKNWLPDSMIKADSLINANKYNNGLPDTVRTEFYK